VDVCQAFIHAPIDKPPGFDLMSKEEQRRQGVYVEMPRGFSQPGKVLKLKKSLYGLRQSPRNYYQFSREKLESIGFKCLEDIDPCLFISDKVIVLQYVDDSLLLAKDSKHIDEVCEQLEKLGVELEAEDDIAGFLGVHIDRSVDGTISLTQSGLIKKIIDTLDIQHLPPKQTPAEDVLTKDENGDPPNGTYNYASVIGMLLYVSGHSRPDIAFAVSQAARFAFAPKRSHEKALERIGQYLKGTIDKGMILKPTESLDIECYVDSDFCGLWKTEDRSDPTSVKSRTGFVICIANCPVVWSSKLQSRIANSTMEAEYNALSSAMKEVLPLQELLRAVAKGVGLPEDFHTEFRTTVWEDNNGALTLANLEPGQHTPRSKWYDISVHWFRSKLKPNSVEVQKIDTTIQRADMLTKALAPEIFIRLRKLLLGW
jgi:hypothetical protein